MANGSSPTVRRRRLGAELRRRREAAGLKIEEVAEQVEWSESKISRVETGRVGVHPTSVRDMLDLYGVTDEDEREALMNLAREARKRGWWSTYADATPTWFRTFLGLESDAAEIQTYQSLFIPGLLQTEAYARALTRANQVEDPPEEVERATAVRMERQAVLTKPGAPRFWVAVDEAALHRPVGGPEVMRDQLHRLLEVGDLPNVTFQVVPYSAGAYPAMASSFTIFSFLEASDADVVYLEHQRGSVYLEKPEDISWYTLAFNHLRVAALSTGDSAALISEVASKHT